MDNNTQMLEVLQRMEKTGRKQLLYTRLQCLFASIAAVCCISVLITLIRFAPQLQELTIQMQTILTNIDTVTKELAAADLGQMVQDIRNLASQVGGLATDSQGAIQEALDKLNTLDLEKLNKAIADFAAIIEPLAKAARWLT